MPPNLGGFFMVRSYYPSECHADYFDFERIEALKPAIEACGISRSEERFSRNAETDLVCRLLLEKKNAAMTPQTKLVWGETPTNTLLRLEDLCEIGAICRERCKLCAAYS